MPLTQLPCLSASSLTTQSGCDMEVSVSSRFCCLNKLSQNVWFKTMTINLVHGSRGWQLGLGSVRNSSGLSSLRHQQSAAWLVTENSVSGGDGRDWACVCYPLAS